jgi:hypothetical protein
MLKDYEFDDDNKSDELQNDGIVCLLGIELEYIILYYFRNEIQQTVFCQTIQGRRGYEFYRLLSI